MAIAAAMVGCGEAPSSSSNSVSSGPSGTVVSPPRADGLEWLTPDIISGGFDCRSLHGEGVSTDYSLLSTELSGVDRWVLVDGPLARGGTWGEPELELNVVEIAGEATEFSSVSADLTDAAEVPGVPDRYRSGVAEIGVERVIAGDPLTTSLTAVPVSRVLLGLAEVPNLPAPYVEMAFAVGDHEELVMLFACDAQPYVVDALFQRVPAGYAGTQLDLIVGNSAAEIAKIESPASELLDGSSNESIDEPLPVGDLAVNSSDHDQLNIAPRPEEAVRYVCLTQDETLCFPTDIGYDSTIGFDRTRAIEIRVLDSAEIDPADVPVGYTIGAGETLGAIDIDLDIDGANTITVTHRRATDG